MESRKHNPILRYIQLDYNIPPDCSDKILQDSFKNSVPKYDFDLEQKIIRKYRSQSPTGTSYPHSPLRVGKSSFSGFYKSLRFDNPAEAIFKQSGRGILLHLEGSGFSYAIEFTPSNTFWEVYIVLAKRVKRLTKKNVRFVVNNCTIGNWQMSLKEKNMTEWDVIRVLE